MITIVILKFHDTTSEGVSQMAYQIKIMAVRIPSEVVHFPPSLCPQGGSLPSRTT